MTVRSMLGLGWSVTWAILLRRSEPLIGSIIVTDLCNLHCRHCAVANIRRELYPWDHLRAEMAALRRDGVRVLFLYGGEPFLWRDGQRQLRDLVIEAKAMGFALVNVVTNGTRPLNLPEADLIMVSVDGSREHHDLIRGETYDRIMRNVGAAQAHNLCLYMAINRINQTDIEAVCEVARQTPTVSAVSFNFHTPYPGTEELQLSRAEKQDCCDRIERLIAAGYPILNLRSAFPAIIAGTAGPARQGVVVEDGERWACGRCIDIPGLCQQCGYFFAAEYSLLFSRDTRVILDFVQTYYRHLFRGGSRASLLRPKWSLHRRFVARTRIHGRLPGVLGRRHPCDGAPPQAARTPRRR